MRIYNTAQTGPLCGELALKISKRENRALQGAHVSCVTGALVYRTAGLTTKPAVRHANAPKLPSPTAHTDNRHPQHSLLLFLYLYAHHVQSICSAHSFLKIVCQYPTVQPSMWVRITLLSKQQEWPSIHA